MGRHDVICCYPNGSSITIEGVIVDSITREYGNRLVQEKYQYVNDGKYTVERKECEH